MFLGGAFASLTLQPIIIPVELFKCRAQAWKGDTKFSIGKAIAETTRTEGIKGCYRGGVLTMVREIPGSGVLLCTKEVMENKFKVHQEQNDKVKTIKKIAASGIAGICAWCISIPLDTVKTFVQSDHEKKLNFWSTTQLLYKQGGLKIFYNGLIPQIVRIFPQSATMLLVYEKMHNILS